MTEMPRDDLARAKEMAADTYSYAYTYSSDGGTSEDEAIVNYAETASDASDVDTDDDMPPWRIAERRQPTIDESTLPWLPTALPLAAGCSCMITPCAQLPHCRGTRLLNQTGRTTTAAAVSQSIAILQCHHCRCQGSFRCASWLHHYTGIVSARMLLHA